MQSAQSFYGMGLLVSAFIVTPAASHGEGISTPFADVQMSDVQLGSLQLVKDGQGRGLELSNSGDAALEIDIQVLVPQKDQLRGAAEPIPDTTWLRVEPSQFILGAHEKTNCIVRLEIPKEKRYLKQYYQAMIWSRARPVGKTGMAMSMGLLSRLRFRTAIK